MLEGPSERALEAPRRVFGSHNDVVERYALQRRVADALMETAEPYRTVLLLHYFEDMPTRAIAERTNASGEAVRKRLSRGRALLRERLDREGEDCRSWLGILTAEEPRVRWRDVLLTPPLAVAAAVIVAGLIFQWQNSGELEDQLAYAPAEEVEGAAEVHLAGLGLLGVSYSKPATQDQADSLSNELGVELSAVQALEPQKPASEVRELAKRAGVKPKLLRSAELFSARMRNPRSGEEVQALIARLFLPDVSKDARLVFAAADGVPIGLGLWGTPAFDTDPDSRWGLFAEELLLMAGKTTIGKETLSLRAFEKHLKALENDEEHGLFVRGLLRQRTAMLGNMLYSRGLKRNRSSLPGADWFPALAQAMNEVGAVSTHFERVLGDATAEHARRAKEAAQIYAAMGLAVETGDRAKLDELGTQQNALCHTCHDSVLADGQLTWFKGFDSQAEEFDLPRGMLRIGYDLAPALGDDGILSQRLADALRAGLIYLDALK